MAMNFRPTTEIDLAGHNFLITHWGPMKAMKNMPKIGKIVAVPMGAIGGSILSGGQNMAEVLPTALAYLFQELDEDAVEELFKILFEDIVVDGVNKVDPDVVFSGHLLDMIKLAGKVLEVNYGCFFTKDGLGSLLEMLQQMGMIQQVNNLDQPQEQE
ncbi:phage tail assembly chaperone [Escherichia coli]|uniref:phage tail assembly chaperone n=1 Tax=Escherichia coli TaxID=562 RepID=UPI000CFC975B|nr:hypothetical protein [Escherichia coli]